MIDDLRRYPGHYLVLFVILGGSLVTFLFFGHSRLVKFRVAFLTSLAYLLWGIFHHYLKKDLNLTIIIEYTLVAIFSMVVIYTVLAQS